MKLTLFHLILTIEATFAFITDRCDIAKCSFSSPVAELQAIRYMPSERQLQRLCPKTLDYLTCIFSVVETCVGHTVDILALSSNKSVASTAKAIVEIDYLTVDVCDEKSWFRRAYLTNIDCFRKFINRNTRSCKKEAKYQMRKFFDAFNLTDEVINATVYAELQCLESAFEYVCVSEKLRCACCEYARWTYVTVLERLSAILRELHCPRVEEISLLKEEVLNFQYDDESYKRETRKILDIFID